MNGNFNLTAMLIVLGVLLVGTVLGWFLTKQQVDAMGPAPKPQTDNPVREAKTEQEVAEEKALKETQENLPVTEGTVKNTTKEDPRPVTSMLNVIQANKVKISDFKENQAQGTSGAARAALKKLDALRSSKANDSKNLTEDTSNNASTVATNAALATALLADLTPAGDKAPEGYEENTPVATGQEEEKLGLPVEETPEVADTSEISEEVTEEISGKTDETVIEQVTETTNETVTEEPEITTETSEEITEDTATVEPVGTEETSSEEITETVNEAPVETVVTETYTPDTTSYSGYSTSSDTSSSYSSSDSYSPSSSSYSSSSDYSSSSSSSSSFSDSGSSF